MTRVPRWVLAALAFFLVSLSPAARADSMTFNDVTPTTYHSPQHFALEFKGGLYSPDIDSSPGLGGKTPFSDLFNAQSPTSVGKRPGGRLLFTVEFDWQFWHPFGSFALGVSGGVMSRNTHAFQYNVPDLNGQRGSCTVPYCTRSGDGTTLSVMPLTLELIYRFDVLALRYNIPIVPYIKGGLGYFMWFVQNGGGGLATYTNPDSGKSTSGWGGTAGLVLHPGLALMLDVFDKSAARTLDAELGINHTYVFAELNYAVINGLGISNRMVLSDTTWNAGVAFEF